MQKSGKGLNEAGSFQRLCEAQHCAWRQAESPCDFRRRARPSFMFRGADLLQRVFPEHTAAQKNQSPAENDEATEEQDSNDHPNGRLHGAITRQSIHKYARLRPSCDQWP